MQPGLLPRLQVETVKERPVSVRRRAVAAQVDRCPVLSHGPGAVGVGGHERRAGIGVGVVHGVVEQDPVALGLGQVADPGGQPPAVAVMLGQQQPLRPLQVEPAEAALPDIERALRLPGERCVQPHHLVAMLGRGDRVTAVQGLGPDQAGRRALLPGDLPRAGRHPLPRNLVADRKVGDHPLQPARGRPHLDAAGKVLERDPERERPPQPVDQQVLGVRRVVQAAVEAGRAEFLRRSGSRLDPQRNRGRQRLERVRVGGRAQQILIGRHLGPLARRFLGVRLDGRHRQRRRRGGRAERQQPAAVARPPDGRAHGKRVTAEHVADPQPGHLPGGPRPGVRHPYPDAVRLVHGEREPAPVRRPRGHARLCPVRQGQGLLCPVRQPQHGKPGQPAYPLAAGQDRIDPDPGQRQVRAREHGDGRMRLVVHQGDEPPARRQQRQRGGRRVDDRDDIVSRRPVRHS